MKYANRVKKEMTGWMGYTPEDADILIASYPNTINHAEVMGSTPDYPAFQMALHSQGKEADIHIADIKKTH